MTLVATAGGRLVAQAQKSSGGLASQDLTTPAPVNPRKNAWRQVRLQ